MRSWMAVLTLVAVASHAGAATQTILGGTFDLRVSATGDPARSRVLVCAATPARPRRRSSSRPRGGTRPSRGWPVYMGFRCTSAVTGGPVRSITIERSGFSSPEGTPPPAEPKPGKFRTRIQLIGRDGPIDVVPPNSATEAGVELTLGGGDTYCLVFGGAAGERLLGNTSRRYGVRKPLAEGCP